MDRLNPLCYTHVMKYFTILRRKMVGQYVLIQKNVQGILRENNKLQPGTHSIISFVYEKLQKSVGKSMERFWKNIE